MTHAPSAPGAKTTPHTAPGAWRERVLVRDGQPTLFGDDDLFLFNEGTHVRLYRKLGARVIEHEGKRGAYFAVWAPGARRVSVVGMFNGWEPGRHDMRPVKSSGIWELFLPGLDHGTLYKFHVEGHSGYRADKSDPFSFCREIAPKTADVLWGLEYTWGDSEWLASRSRRAGLDKPMSIYEVHLGSWMRNHSDGYRSLHYTELATKLADYCHDQGFTHVEFLPVMEHPLYQSWGYQTTGYFAPTSRFGTPQEFMGLIDALHQRGIGVILDWVPSHFPNDEHGLAYFDGTHLFEHEDPRLGFHPDWKSAIFNYGRHEVRAFLVSSALFWLDVYHADGLRVDAVASMLYRDYSRREGEWIPNRFGGRENLEAIDFLRQLNAAAYGAFPDTCMIAEESTAWPMVSRPTYLGGLGFGYKWDMGWMHDTLKYLARDPVHRKHHHNELTFRGLYQFTENYVLPISHDEVVHGKGSLLAKMAGDDWQQKANLRLLLVNQWTQPGKKLLFMGCEIGQRSEWNHDAEVEWDLLRFPDHQGIQRLVRELNRVYRDEPALHEEDCDPHGHVWIEANDAADSVLAFLRRGKPGGRGSGPGGEVVVLLNCTPVPRPSYQIGVPFAGYWRELLNSDATEFGGSGQGNMGGVEATSVPRYHWPATLTVNIPPLAGVILKHDPGAQRK